jgi:hypothetical protein
LRAGTGHNLPDPEDAPGAIMHRITLPAAVALLLLSTLLTAAVSPLTERYINVFSGTPSRSAELDALNQLQWSGLSDPRLFDLLETRLLNLYPSARGDDVDLASWYAKALGTSGLDKYRATLQGIVDSKANGKIRKYAQEGIDNIAKYAEWNPVISARDGLDPDKPEQTNAFVNMLRSDDWALKNMAAKRIYADRVYDTYLLDALDTEIKALYPNNYQSSLEVQTVAWMCRALASSRDPSYRATLQTVAAEAGSSKVRNYARKYLKQNY